MKRKKLILPLVAIILCAALGIGVFIVMENNKITNVFDEMYLSVKNPRISKTSFHLMKDVGRLTNEPEMDYFYWGGYRTTSLDEREYIYISSDLDKQTFFMSANLDIENRRCLAYRYRYDFRPKTLTIEPLRLFTYDYLELEVEQAIDDPEEIDAFLQAHNITRAFIEKYRNYFLYDKMLKDWVTGNGERSLFSVDNYGEFTVIDNTFANLGEDWGAL